MHQALKQRFAPEQCENVTWFEASNHVTRNLKPCAALQLFRTGGELLWQSVDLADMVAHLPFEALSITARDAGHVEADPDLLAAALMNLLDNSLRHGATMIDISTRARTDGVSILVRDDGTGMGDEDRSRLQAALDRQAYDGATGLGLMLGDLMARAHRGRLLLVPTTTGCVIEIRLGLPLAVAGTTDKRRTRSVRTAPT